MRKLPGPTSSALLSPHSPPFLLPRPLRLYQESSLALSRLSSHEAQPPLVQQQLLHCVLKKARPGRTRWILQLLKGGLDQVIIWDGHWLLQLGSRLRAHGAMTVCLCSSGPQDYNSQSSHSYFPPRNIQNTLTPLHSQATSAPTDL